MNLEEDLLKYIERFKKKNNGKDSLLNNYIMLYLIGNEMIKKKKKEDIKKLVKKYKLEDPFYIDKIMLYNNTKDKTIKNLMEYLVKIFYERDFKMFYDQKIEEIKKNSKNIKINIVNSNLQNKDIITGIMENIYKLDFDDTNIDIFMKMIMSKNNVHEKTNIEKLYESKLILPITSEFNRYHKSTFKTETNKKNTRANNINNRINETKKDFTDKKQFIDINNYYSILYNKIEEINILNRFLTEDGYFIKNIDNRESYIELKKNHDTKYFNFQKNKFMYNTNTKMISLRSSLNKKYENKLEIRNIKKDENIDIIGFILSKNTQKLFQKGKQSFESIQFFNKNLKSIFQKNKNFIYFIENSENQNIEKIFELIINFMKKYIIKKRLIKKYIFLFNEKEKSFFDIYKMYHTPLPFKNEKIEIKNNKNKIDKLKINEKEKINYSILNNNQDEILNKKIKVDKKNSNKVCIHILELNEKKDHLYIINKYGKLMNELFVCKYCNGIIINNNNTAISNNDNYEIIYNNVNEEYSHLEEDLLEIEKVSKKIVKILKVPFLKDKKETNLYLSNLMKLLKNHNNLKLNKIDINHNILTNKDDNQKKTVLIYICILILIDLSKSDINNFFRIDNICNYNNFQKNNKFFDNLLISNIQLKKYNLLCYCIFTFSCIISKYIVNIQDKALFNKNIKVMIFIFISIMDKIIKSDDVIYQKYKNIFLYKLNSLYKFNLKEKAKKKEKKNQNTKYTYISKDNKIKNIFLQKKYKNHKFSIKFDLSKEKNIKVHKFTKKKLIEKVMKTKKLLNISKIPKDTLSLKKFIEKHNLTDENQYYIDFNLNGYPTNTKVYIKYDKVSVMTYKNEQYIMIYNPELKIYMYFHKYYLYYIGYSITKNASNLELYKNDNVYLKIDISLKNKFKYLGYTNLFYHILIDKNIYENINSNINKIMNKLNEMMNILKNSIVIKNPIFKYEKMINNLIKNKNKNKKIIYNNEFNIVFNIYSKKLGNNKTSKSILFMRDVYDNNLFSSIHLQYFYYIMNEIINKNKFLKDILFEFINEQFDLYFVNHHYVEYKNKYKIYYDCHDFLNIQQKEDDYIEEKQDDNEDTFNYDELDIEENPFDTED